MLFGFGFRVREKEEWSQEPVRRDIGGTPSPRLDVDDCARSPFDVLLVRNSGRKARLCVSRAFRAEIAANFLPATPPGLEHRVYGFEKCLLT